MYRLGIRNWRIGSRDRERWRSFINRHVTAGPMQKNIKEKLHGYKIGANKRRAEETAKARRTGPKKVTEILVTNVNGSYICPKCHKTFKPQKNTEHVKPCAHD